MCKCSLSASLLATAVTVRQEGRVAGVLRVFTCSGGAFGACCSRLTYASRLSQWTSTLLVELALDQLQSPKSELSDFSRPLRAPPEASADKTELTADGAFRACQLKRLARVASMA